MHVTWPRGILFALFYLATAALPASAGHVRYRIVDLGTLGGDFTDAIGINNTGQVVGDASGGSGVFLWENGQMFDLAELVEPGSGWTLGTAKAINDDGWITGTGDNPAGESAGFLLTPVAVPRAGGRM